MTRIFDPSIDWSDQGNPISSGFDDVYYSRQNGLQETDLVFLKGNNLPEAWQGKSQFTIAETGFGTGLNFLAAWRLFEQTAQDGERLDFISVEQFPIPKDQLAKALGIWRGEIDDHYIDRLLAVYPMRIPGFHRLWITDRVTLTLIFDEALRGFKQLTCPVDAWFLDGFAPKKNPDMWNSDLYSEIARLSHSETTLGSFTAVGHVRRGLAAVGFTVKRAKGYGYKYHRTVGKFDGPPKQITAKPKSVTIIGAGIAGAACAFALKRRGIVVNVLDRNMGPGQGASGNSLGLINPRIEAQDNPRNDAGLSAFSFATHVLKDFNDIEYKQNGALHLPANDRKKDKLDKIIVQAGWLQPHMQAKENGVFFHDSGSVNTAKLVEKLLADIPVDYNTEFKSPSIPQPALQSDLIILACGLGNRNFIDNKIRLQPVRGQVTYAEIPELELAHPLMFGHYIAPVDNNLYSLGASFEKNSDQPAISEKDDQDNISAAKKHVVFNSYRITGNWAQIRTASHDRFPIVGKMPGNETLYFTGALGSHGIQFGLLHGEILACMLTGAPLPVGRDALQSLSIDRFYQD